VLWAALAAWSSGAFADFPAAQREYRQDNHGAAYAGFFEGAILGHAASQHQLAVMTLRGHGLPADPAAALGWLKAAESNGHSGDAAVMTELVRQVGAGDVSRVDGILAKYGRVALEENVLPRFDRPCVPWQRAVPRWNQNPAWPDDLMGHEGVVLIEFLLGVDGIARDPEILVAKPSRLYNLSAVDALMRSRFEPALCGTSPCQQRTYHRYYYNYHRLMGLRPQDRLLLENSSEAIAELWGAGAIEKARERVQQREPDAEYLLGSISLADDRLGVTSLDSAGLILRAAQGGNTDAQYWIGRYIDDHESCLGALKAVPWLEVAARHGHARSRALLARILLRKPDPRAVARARELLQAIEPTAGSTALRYAAGLLATSPIAELRDPKHALGLASRLYFDYANLDPQDLEVYAAALAANDQFLHAYRRQRRAVKQAQGLGWNTSLMEERRATYGARKPWTGDLFYVPPARP
jgi:TPR repeat protein